MKKIFAIALAVVMVLSMASAFALTDCSVGDFAWGCPAKETNCAKATVEVVPFVRVNDACNGWKFVESDCASAINQENVYFALKLTVPADFDPLWWAAATLGFELKGVEGEGKYTLNRPTGFADANEDGWEFYWANGQWNEVEDANFDLQKMVITKKVVEYAKAKVCMTIKSYDDGFGTWTYGDYTVVVAAGSITITKDCGNSFVMTWGANGKVNAITASSDAFLNEVKGVFNLENCVIGTCVNADNIEANFGWDDKQESCFAWSDKGASVVDTDCVVAIPKTGDASVLAWLF